MNLTTLFHVPPVFHRRVVVPCRVSALTTTLLVIGGLGVGGSGGGCATRRPDATANPSPTARPAESGVRAAAPLDQQDQGLLDVTDARHQGGVGGLAGRIAQTLTGRSSETPAQAAARLNDRDFPDERRIGINRLVGFDFGAEPPYTDAYATLARTDRDPLVRATAVRALHRAGAGASTGVFITGLNDPSELVRLESAKALANLPDESAIDPLLSLMNDVQQPKDVRIAAADALRHYRTAAVARALVGQLNGRDFGVSWQARQSLRFMTDADFRYDEPAWLAFLTGEASPLT